MFDADVLELWPAVVRLAERIPVSNLAQIHEVHTASGKHVTKGGPYAQWVPEPVSIEARELSEAAALSQLGPWVEWVCLGNAAAAR